MNNFVLLLTLCFYQSNHCKTMINSQHKSYEECAKSKGQSLESWEDIQKKERGFNYARRAKCVKATW